MELKKLKNRRYRIIFYDDDYDLFLDQHGNYMYADEVFDFIERVEEVVRKLQQANKEWHFTMEELDGDKLLEFADELEGIQ